MNSTAGIAQGILTGLLILGVCFMFNGCDERLNLNEAALQRTADALETIALTLTNEVTQHDN